MKRYLWIIEIYENGKWMTTVGGGLSRQDARRDLVDWKHNNPCDEFRIRKYVPEKS